LQFGGTPIENLNKPYTFFDLPDDVSEQRIGYGPNQKL
jgi:hypothetical protein